MKRVNLLISMVLFVFLSVFLSGCGMKRVAEVEPVPVEIVDGLGIVEPLEGLGAMEPLDTIVEERFAIKEGRTSGPMVPIYFAFDKSKIEGDQITRIEKNAEFIKQHPYLRVRIEGNTDPRGTREYNLALGERRAQSAASYLVNLGVDMDNLTTISWGEEKLLLFGQDELSWAQNRRADFVILQPE